MRAEVRICVERARLITEFQKSDVAQGLPIPVQRALAFKYLMERVSLPVEEGQLIVGLRGTGPKMVPTYPEICVHSLEDLKVLNTRESMPYQVDEGTKRLYAEEIIPFWRGKSMRDLLFRNLPKEWVEAYEAGVWTEFMEQRAPGHTAGGTRVFRMGLLDINAEIAGVMKNLDPTDPKYHEKLVDFRPWISLRRPCLFTLSVTPKNLKRWRKKR